MFQEISHRLFLYVVTQLLTMGKMKIEVCGLQVTLQVENHTGKWLLSTKVGGDSEMKNECFRNQSKAIFHQPFSYLVEGEEGVYFQRAIQPAISYTFFRKLFAAYIEEAGDWKKIFA